MSRCVDFKMHIKGKKDDKEKFLDILNKISRIDISDIVEKNNDVTYINGWATTDISGLLFQNDENNVVINSEKFKLECEWFESDPGEPEFIIHYYISNGKILKAEADAPYFYEEEYADNEDNMNEDYLKKYHIEEWNEKKVYVLNKEFFPEAKWDEDFENLICNFEIVADESERDSSFEPNFPSFNKTTNKYESDVEIVDKKSALEYAKKYGLEDLDEEYRNDKTIVLAAIENRSSYDYNYASDELKKDKDVVLAMVDDGNCADNFYYAPDEIKNDKDLVIEAIGLNEYVFSKVSDKLKGDKDVAMAAVSKYGCLLEYASTTLKDDYDLVITAVENDPDALQYASERLKNNNEIVMTALKNDK